MNALTPKARRGTSTFKSATAFMAWSLAARWAKPALCAWKKSSKWPRSRWAPLRAACLCWPTCQKPARARRCATSRAPTSWVWPASWSCLRSFTWPTRARPWPMCGRWPKRRRNRSWSTTTQWPTALIYCPSTCWHWPIASGSPPSKKAVVTFAASLTCATRWAIATNSFWALMTWHLKAWRWVATACWPVWGAPSHVKPWRSLT